MAKNHEIKIAHAMKSTSQMYRMELVTNHAPKTSTMMNSEVRSHGSQMSVAASGLCIVITPKALLALKYETAVVPHVQAA